MQISRRKGRVVFRVRPLPKKFSRFLTFPKAAVLSFYEINV